MTSLLNSALINLRVLYKEHLLHIFHKSSYFRSALIHLLLCRYRLSFNSTHPSHFRPSDNALDYRPFFTLLFSTLITLKLSISPFFSSGAATTSQIHKRQQPRSFWAPPSEGSLSTFLPSTREKRDPLDAILVPRFQRYGDNHFGERSHL